VQPEDDIPFGPDLVVTRGDEELDIYRLPSDAPPRRRYLYEVAVQIRRVGTSDVSTVSTAVLSDELVTNGAALDAALEAFPHADYTHHKVLGGLVTAVYDRDA
jgi:hypothetical protein